jgi:hypothetical protein
METKIKISNKNLIYTHSEYILCPCKNFGIEKIFYKDELGHIHIKRIFLCQNCRKYF